MKAQVNENRMLYVSGIAGTQNENDVTELEITVPEKYADYNKKIVFLHEGQVIGWDIVENNTYTVKKSVTKHRRVQFYVWLTKGEDDFRSETKEIEFNENIDASDEITEEEMGRVNTVINLLEEEITKVTDLEKEVQTLINDIQFKLDNGEFNGKDYVLTEEDKAEIADTVKPMVEETIKPTLENNLKSAKDYTDNSIARDFKDVSYDSDTATFVFTRHDNTTFTVDLPIEQTVKNGYYDETTKELVLVLVSNQEIRIPATGLIDDYAGVETDTIQLIISATNQIIANIKAGSIVKTLLSQELQDELDAKLVASDLADYIKNTDIATKTNLGIVKEGTNLGIRINTNGELYIDYASNTDIDSKSSFRKSIVPANLVYAVKVGGEANNYKPIVSLTQAEYDALTTIDENTIYIIKEE